MNFTLANTAITARALLDFLDEYRVSVTFLTLVNCWIFLEESLASLTFLTLLIFCFLTASSVSYRGPKSGIYWSYGLKSIITISLSYNNHYAIIFL